MNSIQEIEDQIKKLTEQKRVLESETGKKELKELIKKGLANYNVKIDEFLAIIKDVAVENGFKFEGVIKRPVGRPKKS